MHRSDEELVQACRDGDESAWEAIVYKYQKLLFSIPRRARLSMDLAADVVQEVFVTLYQKLDDLERPEFLRAWLVTTTKHKTLHLISVETRLRSRSIDDDGDGEKFEIPDPAIGADEALVRLERQVQLEEALTKIGERCRRLLISLYLVEEKIPYAVLAQEFNIPLGSIGPTRARCLEKVLKFLPDR